MVFEGDGAVDDVAAPQQETSGEAPEQAPEHQPPPESIDEKKEKEEYLQVKLMRSDETSYGFAYRVFESSRKGQQIVITGVLPYGAADVWNRGCENLLTVCAGDVISTVNGITSPKEMIAELKENLSCQLRILKSGPRWHLVSEHHHVKTKAVLFGGSIDEEIEEEMPPYSVSHWFLLFAIVFFPCCFLNLLFSDMFAGMAVYNGISSASTDFRGRAMCAMAMMMALGLYVLDWRLWTSKGLKSFVAVFVLYFLLMGMVLMARSYPQTPFVVFLGHIPVLLGVVRSTLGKTRSRSGFYVVVSVCLFIMAAVVLGGWFAWLGLPSFGGENWWNADTQLNLANRSKALYVSYDIDYLVNCSDDRDRTLDAALSSAQMDEQTKGCSAVKTTWFMAWGAPMFTGMTCFVIGAFCGFCGVWLKSQHASRLEKLLKMFVLLASLMGFGMYTASSVAGSSMRMANTLTAFLGTAIVCLVIWFYVEIGEKAISSVVRSSKLMQTIILFAMSDWARAFFMISMGLVIPVFFVMNSMNQKVRRWRGLSHSDAWFTEGTQKVLIQLEHWNWVSILSKVNLACELFFTFQVGVSKLTIIALSWLNGELAGLSLISVVIIFVFIGLVMFLLPPVPGIPVYVTSGLIIATKADSDGLGLGVGIVIACGTSFILKLLACSGQYSIGLAMGKSIYIQKLVGVDKAPIRSVEKILQTRGLNLPKVAILVGGPDWPTSVLCGILKLSLPQILWGTCPVIFVSSPCVFAGAFLAAGGKPCNNSAPFLPPVDPNEIVDESANYGTYASTMMIVSAIVQLCSMGLAMYYILETMQKHGDELAKPRKEHEPIEELTRQKEHYMRCYADITEWHVLDKSRKPILIASAVMMIYCCYVFMLFDGICFNEFEASSRICHSIADGGLDGNPLNIVRPPGIPPLLAFSVAVLLHIAFMRWSQNEAKAMLLSEIKQSMDSSTDTEESSDAEDSDDDDLRKAKED